MIELHDIRKIYQLGDEEVHALDGVTLTIQDHEFVAIIGASGSGKSTLMNIIGCLDTADEGTYMIDGQEVSDLSERQQSILRNRKIGFIFQQFNLLPKLTAYENVELPLIYQGVSAHERKERVLEALTKVDLAHRVHHRPNQLSGGQQQRVAVARALVTRPSLILADEPTGNLDSHSTKDIMNLLQDLHKQGNTLVLITHDNEIAAQAPRRVRLFDGRIISDSAADTPDSMQNSVSPGNNPDSGQDSDSSSDNHSHLSDQDSTASANPLSERTTASENQSAEQPQASPRSRGHESSEDRNGGDTQ